MLWALIIFLVVYLMLIVSGHLLFSAVALRSTSKDRILSRAYEENGYDPYREELEQGWVENQTDVQNVTIHPAMAPVLHAYHIPSAAGREEHRWVIASHDYACDGRYTGTYSKWFHERGFHLLIPDARACGKSEGRILGLGYADHYDLKAWIRKVLEMDPDARIVLFGLGTGAAASLFCAVENEPVCGVISDSSYAGLKEAVMAHLMSRLGGMTKVVTNFADTEYSLLCGLRNSWRRGNLWQRISKCKIPLMLIHGEEDYFFPVKHLEVLEEKVIVPHTTLRVEGAGHIACCHSDPEKYWTAAGDFLDKVLG